MAIIENAREARRAKGGAAHSVAPACFRKPGAHGGLASPTRNTRGGTLGRSHRILERTSCLALIRRTKKTKLAVPSAAWFTEPQLSGEVSHEAARVCCRVSSRVWGLALGGGRSTARDAGDRLPQWRITGGIRGVLGRLPPRTE